MSNTPVVFAKPLYSAPMDTSVDNLDLRGNQIPNTETNDLGSAGQDTQTNSAATSDGNDQALKERYVNLKRHHDSSIFEARKRIKELEQLASSTGKLTPPKTEEEMKQFATANPEMYAAMESMMIRSTSPEAVDTNRLAKLEEELLESRQHTAIEQIKRVHPDMNDVLTHPNFEAWLGQQSTMVKGLVENNSTDSAAFIRALDLYKLDTGTASTNNATSSMESNDASAADAVVVNGASSVDVDTPQGRIWTREEIGKLKPRDYALHEEEIDTAWAEGRVR